MMDSRDYEDAYQRDDAPREVKSNRAWRLECESLRKQLADERLCHQVTKERLHDVSLDWQVTQQQLANMKSICQQQHVALVQASNNSYLGKHVAEAIAAYEKMFGEE